MYFKKTFNFSFIIILIIPFFLYILTFCFEKNFDVKLNGYFDKVEKPIFSKTSWLSGKYQKDTEKYCNTKIKPRGLYIRLYNQLQYSLFNLSNRIIGKNKNIFEINYISAECGWEKQKQFNLEENQKELDDYITHLINIQRKLKILNKQFLFFITPSKGYYDYDSIPYKYKCRRNSSFISGYDYLKIQLKKLSATELNWIDSRDFINENYTLPIFYKTGIHWARPIEQILSKEIIMQLSTISDKACPQIELKDIRCSTRPIWRDADVFDLCNIFSPPKDTYYEFKAEIANLNAHIPCLFIQGGSFAEGLWHDYFANFPNSFYMLFYNRALRKGGLSNQIAIKSYDDVNIDEYLKLCDWFIIEINESVIFEYSNGFAEYFDKYLDSYMHIHY